MYRPHLGTLPIFGRLWEDQRLPEVIRHLAQGRGFQFEVERAVFALALQRLCAPGAIFPVEDGWRR